MAAVIRRIDVEIFGQTIEGGVDATMIFFGAMGTVCSSAWLTNKVDLYGVQGETRSRATPLRIQKKKNQKKK